VVPEDSQAPIGMRDYALRAAKNHLDDLVTRLAVDGVVAEAFVREGNTAAEIITFAGVYEVTAIVMGTHGRSGMMQLLAGSVAERVVRTSSVPVVTVRGE
jgi:nucleotide-binding universal stress UspA family protein